MPKSYRDRTRYGAYVFLCRLDDETTLLDKQGEPERFSFDEACKIDRGAEPAMLLAERKPLDKPAPKPAETHTEVKRGPGRPAKDG